MNNLYKSILLIGLTLPALIGCGSHSNSNQGAKPTACADETFTGTLQDSLTGQPVPKAQILLESGTPEANAIVYSFVSAGQTVSAPDGTFQLCTPAVQSPSAVVITALDTSGNAYPAFIAPMPTATSLGVISLGGCTVLCGLDGQQQSSAPATIAGVITTDPIAKTVLVTPQYAIAAPDGSGHLWNLLIPPLNPAQSFTLQTAPGAQAGCAGQSSPCAAYSFVLPSQKPIVAGPQSNTEQAGTPVYSISASITGTPSCTPPSVATSFREDDVSPLLAAPGAQLTAEPIHFKACD